MPLVCIIESLRFVGIFALNQVVKHFGIKQTILASWLMIESCKGSRVAVALKGSTVLHLTCFDEKDLQWLGSQLLVRSLCAAGSQILAAGHMRSEA